MRQLYAYAANESTQSIIKLTEIYVMKECVIRVSIDSFFFPTVSPFLNNRHYQLLLGEITQQYTNSSPIRL